MIPYLNLVVANFFSINFSGLIFGALVGIIYMISSVIYGNFGITKRVLFLILFIFMSFMISYMISNYHNVVVETLIQFFYYGVISILVSSKPISVRHILKYSIILSMVGILDFSTHISVTSGHCFRNYPDTLSNH